MPYKNPKDNNVRHAIYRGEPGSPRRAAYNRMVQARRKLVRSQQAIAELEAQQKERREKELAAHYGYEGRINVQRY